MPHGPAGFEPRFVQLEALLSCPLGCTASTVFQEPTASLSSQQMKQGDPSSQLRHRARSRRGVGWFYMP